MTNEVEYVVFGEVNEAGHDALVAWLEKNMKNPHYAEAVANDLISKIDGSYAADCGMSVELRGMSSASGNPETYCFSAGEYDLVTMDDFGNEISRRVAE